MSGLFAGPPLSAEARRLHRPLTEIEKETFRRRILVDAALQENINWVVGWPLCNIDFDWKCTDVKKWVCAIDLLMVTYQDGDITPSEQALVDGQVGKLDYADRSQHARIHAIERIVRDLRDSYDPVWKPNMLAIDQRAINAVSSPGFGLYYYSAEHAAWATAFMDYCKEEGVDVSASGHYQKRLEIYRRMSPLYNEGLSKSFHNGYDDFENARTPANFERDDPIALAFPPRKRLFINFVRGAKL
jgi:hypothetical protein